VSQASGGRVAVSEHHGGGSRIRQRQRQRLIDACISALHIYGPSNTTVEKVVALADLSPGIVRFYFDSKAAMLVASLEHLAAEFAERVLDPVARLKDTPVQALRLLVNLYLDAEIASPRKVSVWYAFWGEASARQEYQDICGQKDEEFAALMRELMRRMIAVSGAGHLDADAVALGLRWRARSVTCSRSFRASSPRPCRVRRRAAGDLPQGPTGCRHEPTSTRRCSPPSASSCCGRRGRCSAMRLSCARPVIT